MRCRMVLILCLLVSGCSFRAPQLETALEMVRGGESVEEEVAALAWRLEWLGDTSTVYPVVVEDLIVFTNPSELQVIFDGWQVLGTDRLLPRRRSVRIEVGEERRSLTFLENGLPLLAVDCDPWVQSDDASGVRRWAQRCDGLDEPNLMWVNAAGETTELRYVIHPSYPPVRLLKGAAPAP